MAQLIGLGVKRLRSLYDLSPPLDLRPITLLLGKNSVGKSTFGRLLPLLRQSSERRKRSPILWLGDFVDFGSLPEAVTRGERDLELSFKLRISEKELERRQRQTAAETRIVGFRPNANPIRITRATVSITLTWDEKSGAAYASRFSLSFHGIDVEAEISPTTSEVRSVQIDGRDFRISESTTRVLVSQGSVLPRLLFYRQDSEQTDRWLAARNVWRGNLVREVGRRLHGNTATSTILRLVGQLSVAPKAELVEQIRRLEGPQAWELLGEIVNEHHPFIEDLHRALIAANLDTIIELFDDSLRDIFEGVRYLKPLRATAERYYRRLDLAVSEIDPEGRNFPMFLDSLNHQELAAFQAWIKKYLDLDIAPEREGAQLMVMAKTANDTAMSNIADMGFGISQILPVAAQLWSASNPTGQGTTLPSFIVIEQPELHLHPEYQARLADVFAGFVQGDARRSRSLRTSCRLVIETHSPHLVNRLGALIEKGVIAEDDVSIILFEEDPDRVDTAKVQVARFDEAGVLQNWPYGFFDPQT